MPSFSSLQQHRNNADPHRRQSMCDQNHKAGMFSQFFHKYVAVLGNSVHAVWYIANQGVSYLLLLPAATLVETLSRVY